MRLEEVIGIIAFLVLLIAAIFMSVSFYVCDKHTCHSFDKAREAGVTGSVAYNSSLLDSLFYDGLWPLPYIGAAILTAISIWFLQVPVTVRNFAILFFVSFVVNYFVFVFFGHHYIVPVTDQVIRTLEVSMAPLTFPSYNPTF